MRIQAPLCRDLLVRKLDLGSAFWSLQRANPGARFTLVASTLLSCNLPESPLWRSDLPWLPNCARIMCPRAGHKHGSTAASNFASHSKLVVRAFKVSVDLSLVLLMAMLGRGYNGSRNFRPCLWVRVPAVAEFLHAETRVFPLAKLSKALNPKP